MPSKKADTTAVPEMSRALVQTLNDELKAALVKIGARHGLAARVLNGTYSRTTFNPKVEFAVVNSEGFAETPASQAFRELSTRDGIRASALFQEITVAKRGTYRISGINLRSRRAPYVLTNVETGGSASCGPELLKQYLPKRFVTSSRA